MFVHGEIISRDHFIAKGIYIMDANGQNVKRIYDRPVSHYRSDFFVRPKWSLDGKKIVFMSQSMRESFGHNDICIINADGSNPTPYTNRVEAEVRNPVWTSQGEIVYEGRQKHNGWWKLRVGFAYIQTGGTGDAQDSQVDYRTDGPIVFVKDRKKRGSIPNIYAFDPLTERANRLTFESDSHPRWSPDGTKIVFVRLQAYPQHDIFVMNAEGSFPHNITQHPTDDTDPTWSPNGTHIAFTSNRETFDPHIWTMRADGTNLKKLHPGRAPDWR